MQGPQQKFSPSNHQPIIAAANPKPSLTDSTEINENDSGQEQTSPMLQSTKKTGTNHFVSPAVSAAFEAAAPRRKILVERNENSSSSDGHSHKTSNFVSKGSLNISIPSEHLSPAILLYNSDYDGEVDVNTVADSYLKADDPSKNYLSPRPNFLRLDPNKCEILYFQEKEGTENLTVSCNVDKDEELELKDVKDISISPGKESIEKQENSEKWVEKIEDEGEDEEEEEFEGRGWCLKGVLEFILILIVYSLSISYMCSINSLAPATNPQVNWSLNCTVDTSAMKLYDNGFLAVGVEDSYADKVEIDEGGILLIWRLAKEEMVQNNAVVSEDRKVDNVTDEDAESKDESADKNESKFEKFAQSVGAKAAENEDDYDCKMEKEVDDSNEDNFDEIDGASETEFVGIEVESKIGNLEQVSIHENEDFGGYELEKKEHTFNQSRDNEISAKSDTKELEDEKSSHLVHEVDEIGHDEVKIEIKRWNASTIIGVSLASIVLGSLAFIFGSDKARTASTEKSRSLRESHECAVEETVTTVFPAMEKKVECCARPLLSLSMVEASEEFSFQIQAPKVELIGEVVIGEVNGSFGGYNRKNQMIQSAENMNHLIQTATASNRLPVLDISATNSNSCESSAGENKITNVKTVRSIEMGTKTFTIGAGMRRQPFSWLTQEVRKREKTRLKLLLSDVQVEFETVHQPCLHES